MSTDERPARIALIAAVASNGCIGISNKLPWYLPDDLKYFKHITQGKPVIMGRSTYDSLGRPLPNRTNIVITRNKNFCAADGVKIVHSLHDALAVAQSVAYIAGNDELVIIGGAQIYTEALPLVQRMYLTEVNKSVAGDAFFPAWDTTAWQEIARAQHHYEPANIDYSFAVYERV